MERRADVFGSCIAETGSPSVFVAASAYAWLMRLRLCLRCAPPPVRPQGQQSPANVRSERPKKAATPDRARSCFVRRRAALLPLSRPLQSI